MIATLALLLFQAVASADIVFIDLNAVDAEIAAVREAAAARGEKLIVLPLERAKYVRGNREYGRIHQQMQNAQRELDLCYSSRNGFGSARCEAAQKRVENLMMKEMSAPRVIYGTEDLKADLDKVSGKMTTVMISGHDGDASFYGEFGDISAENFLEAFTENNRGRNVKSVYLLGCGSATAHTFLATWKKAFPDSLFIAGYEGTGYLRESPQGHAFIKKTMLEEKNIIAAETMDKAQRLFKQVSPGDKTHTTAACLTKPDQADSHFLASNLPSGSLLEASGCSAYVNIERVKAIKEFLNCIRRKEQNCNPPSEIPKKMRNSPDGFQYEEEVDEKVCDVYMPKGPGLALTEEEREKIYFYSSFSTSNFRMSILNYSHIIRQLDDQAIRELNIDIYRRASYQDAKENLLKVKRYFEDKLQYENIQNMDISKLNHLADKKRFYDTAWLAVSNLDLSKALELRNGGYSSAPFAQNLGALRAQSFLQYRERTPDAISISDRIKELEETQRNRMHRPTENSVYDVEIQSLKQALIEQERNANLSPSTPSSDNYDGR